jgi:Tfp pilus assembly protein PilN
MKAVNLIPAGEGRRRGAASGIATYAILGVLGLLVVLMAASTWMGNTVADRKAELAKVTAQANDIEARVGDLKSYTDFAAKRKAKVETVQQLISSRFDWAEAMHEVARTLPAGAWVTSLRATASPSSSVEGTSDSLRGSIAAPAIELAGCAKDQRGVAGTITSLRRISGVQRVSLSSSERKGNAGGDDAASSSEGCGAGIGFSLTVFFEAADASAAASTTAPTGVTTP